MTKDILSIADKQKELKKYYDLLMATLDYHLADPETVKYDSSAHYLALKVGTGEIYRKGQLGKLKKWLNDMTEKFRETTDLDFYMYLQKTGYEIDMFNRFFERIKKIRLKGKLSSPSQAYAVQCMIHYLSASEPGNEQEIKELHEILSRYKW